jgi:protease-4
MADFLGISMEVIKSGDAKGGPSFLKPMEKKMLRNQERLVADSFGWFKGLVGQRRKLVGQDLNKVTEGELYTGRMALELGLIDGIGAQRQALIYLQTKGKKFQNIQVKDWSLDESLEPFWSNFFGLSYLYSLGRKIKLLQQPMLFSIAG